MKVTAKLWLGILLLVILSPLGLILPEYFKANSGPGELSQSAVVWHAPLSDYSLGGSKGGGMLRLSFGYIISAITGVAAIVIVAFFIGKKLTKKGG